MHHNTSNIAFLQNIGRYIAERIPVSKPHAINSHGISLYISLQCQGDRFEWIMQLMFLYWYNIITWIGIILYQSNMLVIWDMHMDGLV